MASHLSNTRLPSSFMRRVAFAPAACVRCRAKSKMTGAANIAASPTVRVPPIGAMGRRACYNFHANFTSNAKMKAVQTTEETTLAFAAHQIKSFSIGTFAGVLGSLAGMGGGFVMIPMMTASRQARGVVSGLGLNQHQAHGTSLFAVGTTGLAGALGYGITMGSDDDDNSVEDDVIAQGIASGEANDDDAVRTQSRGVVELDTALALAATAMITARFGAIASSRLSESALQKALGAFMIIVSGLIPGKAYIDDIQRNSSESLEKIAKNAKNERKNQWERLLPSSLIGVFSGFLSGMFGVGGGAIVVPALVLSTDMSHHSALGTSLCAMVMPAMVGVYTHHKKGNVNWRVAPLLALGSSVGAYVGGREIATNLDEGVLRAGFSVLMLVLGAKTWRKGAK